MAQYLLPADTAALQARLAQVTAAYEARHEGARGDATRDGVGPDA